MTKPDKAPPIEDPVAKHHKAASKKPFTISWRFIGDDASPFGTLAGLGGIRPVQNNEATRSSLRDVDCKTRASPSQVPLGVQNR